MKQTNITIFFLIFLYSTLSAQPIIQWQHSFGGSSFDHIRSVKQTYDEGYILGGNTRSSDFDVTGQHGDYDNWIIKLDNTGTLEWKYCFGGTNGEELRSICQTTDSGYFAVGYTTSSDGDVSGIHGGADFWIYKLSKTGILLWQKCLGVVGDEQGKAGIQTRDGGYIVTGWTNSTDSNVTGLHGSYDVWVVKMDSSANVQWEKCFGGTEFDFASAIEQTTDNGFIIGGRTSSNDGDVSGFHDLQDYWIFKIDSIGNLIWQKCLGGSDGEELYGIDLTNDGGCIVGGYTESADGDISGSHGDVEAWVVKLDSTGNMQWQKCLGGSSYDVAYSVQQTSDDGFIISGYSESINGDVTGNHGGGDVWIVKLNSSGVLEWQKCLGGSSGESAYSIRQTNDDGYIIGGLSYSSDGDVTSNYGINDYWVVKLSSVTSINEITHESITLFPNPAKTKMTINYNFQDHLHADIDILDLSGRKIQSSKLTGMNNSYEIDLTEFKNGIYLLRIVTEDGNVGVKKFTVLK